MELIFKTKRLFSFLSFPIYSLVLYAENIAKITELTDIYAAKNISRVIYLETLKLATHAFWK